MDLEKLVRTVEDFPRPGIAFKDITTLLKEPAAFRSAIDQLAEEFAGTSPEVVAGPESRGFIFASALAYRMGAGLVPVRKPGKLPADTQRITYALEYGEDALEIHKDAIHPGQRVLVVDDLLATGGTIRATIDLVERLGAQVVGVGFLIELGFLNGRDRLRDYPLRALIRYD